jgi:uncharacterized protein YjeT (DUF2065 family)
MNDLWAALCLVAVIEGVILFIAPGPWKRAAAEVLKMPDRQVRAVGGIVLVAGLVALSLVRT